MVKIHGYDIPAKLLTQKIAFLLKEMVDKVPKYSRLRVICYYLKQRVITQLHTNLKIPVARLVWLLGKILKLIGRNKESVNLLLKSRRIAKLSGADHEIRQIIRREVLGGTSEHLASLLKSAAWRKAEGYSHRILILKIPTLDRGSVVEKGAIIIKFTETFGAIHQLVDTKLLSMYFRIILEPSWAGYSLPEILVWTGLAPEKIVVLAPDCGDFQLMSELNSNLIPDKLGAADWVDPTKFYKMYDKEKIYDAIYIANYNPIKRVDRFIRAIVRINKKQKNFKAALVCAGHGDARREIQATLEYFKDKANISFFGAKSQSELNLLLNQSKVNLLLSVKEGASKVLTEGFFSGTAGLLLAENVGVNRSNINNQTGKIIPDSELEDALIWFSSHYGEFSPDEWAVSHIAPNVSTEILANKLREIEISEGRQWTYGLLTKVNQPELVYLDTKHDWLLSKRLELLTNFRKGSDEIVILDFLRSLQ